MFSFYLSQHAVAVYPECFREHEQEMVALREGDDKTVAPGPHSPPTVLDHESDSASDWLASDDDEEEGGLRGGQTRLSTGPGLENIGDSSAARRDDDGERDMGAREMDKVQRKHYDVSEGTVTSLLKCEQSKGGWLTTSVTSIGDQRKAIVRGSAQAKKR